ncbi:DUF3667 domain-containing protein [Flavobacterium sp.]
MSQDTVCLNCEKSISGKFCSQCGQKTATHRITFKHFIFHDILHGVWHIEKGILFTLKEALTRPGNAALDYIKGKRISYYNVFYLILLLIGLGVFIESRYSASLLKYTSYVETTYDDDSSSKAMLFIGRYVKFFLALAIPVFALNSFLLFNKKKFYYSEHLIIFGMFYLGIIFFTLVGNLLDFSEFVKPLAFISEWTNIILPIILVLYLIKGLYVTFGKDYKKLNFFVRILIYISLIFVELRIMGLILKAIL